MANLKSLPTDTCRDNKAYQFSKISGGSVLTRTLQPYPVPEIEEEVEEIEAVPEPEPVVEPEPEPEPEVEAEVEAEEVVED